MRNRRPLVLAGCRSSVSILAVLLIALSESAWAANAAAPPGKRLDALEANIRTTEKWIRTARVTESQSTRELREAETKLGVARAELAQLQRDQHELQAQATELTNAIALREAQRKHLLEQAGAHLRALQRTGGGDTLRTLLSAEDPAAAPRLLTYYRYLSLARQQLSARLRQSAQLLTVNRNQLTAQQLQIEQKRAAMQVESDHIATLQANRRTAVATMRKDIGSRAVELKNLQAERVALRRLIESLARRPPPVAPKPVVVQSGKPTPGAEKQPQKQTPMPTSTGSTVVTMTRDTAFARARGLLPWPVQGVLESNYGSAKGSTSLRWEGLLIRANTGTEVRSVHAGEIAFAGWLRSLGNILIVDHGGGFMSLYAHLDSLLRRTGEKVEPGGSLGRVGTSGGRDTPALYFEIRRGGSPINPSDWLTRR